MRDLRVYECQEVSMTDLGAEGHHPVVQRVEPFDQCRELAHGGSGILCVLGIPQIQINFLFFLQVVIVVGVHA